MESVDRSQQCPHDHKVDHNGFLVCSQCGLEIDRIYVSDAVRAYDNEQKTNRPRTSIWVPNGVNTQLIVTKDAQNKLLDGKSLKKYWRLSKIDRQSNDSVKRNVNTAWGIMNKIMTTCKIPRRIMDEIINDYRKYVEMGVCKGRKIEGVLAVTFFLVSKKRGFVFSIDEILENVPVTRKDFSSGLRGLMKIAKTKSTKITIDPYIRKYGTMLHVPLHVVNKAVKLLQKVKSRNMVISGKDPNGLAASFLYIASDMENYKLTQAQLWESTGVTDVTIRKRNAEIKKYLKK